MKSLGVKFVNVEIWELKFDKSENFDLKFVNVEI
jgi:hypothetical protein